jgi:ABC-2 type transport system permease protein
MLEGRIYAFIMKLPEEDRYTVYITEKNLSFGSVLSSILDRFSLETIKPFFRGSMPFEYDVQVISYKGKRLSYIYFLFAGVVGIAMMMNGLFAIPQTIINYRKLGFLKRFAFSPLRKTEFTCSLMLQRLFLGALQVALLTGSAVIIFRLKLTIAPFAFLLTFLVGTAAFSVIGFFLAGIIQSVETAVAVAQIINMLLMFTGGVFFPLEIIPRYFQYVARVNPVYYLAQAVYGTAILGQKIAAIGTDLLILSGLLVAFFLLTISTFRYQRRV